MPRVGRIRATKKALKCKACKRLKLPKGLELEAEYSLGNYQKWLKYKRGESNHG